MKYNDIRRIADTHRHEYLIPERIAQSVVVYMSNFINVRVQIEDIVAFTDCLLKVKHNVKEFVESTLDEETEKAIRMFFGNDKKRMLMQYIQVVAQEM